MRSGDRVIVFSPFVANERDPLFIFSDGVFHEECVDQHPLGSTALAVHQETVERLAPSRRLCDACGCLIVDPDDYFTTGYLTSDPADPLHAFNFVQLHRSHFSVWPRMTELRRLLEEERARGRWQGATLP